MPPGVSYPSEWKTSHIHPLNTITPPPPPWGAYREQANVPSESRLQKCTMPQSKCIPQLPQALSAWVWRRIVWTLLVCQSVCSRMYIWCTVHSMLSSSSLTPQVHIQMTSVQNTVQRKVVINIVVLIMFNVSIYWETYVIITNSLAHGYYRLNTFIQVSVILYWSFSICCYILQLQYFGQNLITADDSRYLITLQMKLDVTITHPVLSWNNSAHRFGTISAVALYCRVYKISARGQIEMSHFATQLSNVNIWFYFNITKKPLFPFGS